MFLLLSTCLHCALIHIVLKSIFDLFFKFVEIFTYNVSLSPVKCEKYCGQFENVLWGLPATHIKLAKPRGKQSRHISFEIGTYICIYSYIYIYICIYMYILTPNSLVFPSLFSQQINSWRQEHTKNSFASTSLFSQKINSWG